TAAAAGGRAQRAREQRGVEAAASAAGGAPADRLASSEAMLLNAVQLIRETGFRPRSNAVGSASRRDQNTRTICVLVLIMLCLSSASAREARPPASEKEQSAPKENTAPKEKAGEKLRTRQPPFGWRYPTRKAARKK